MGLDLVSLDWPYLEGQFRAQPVWQKTVNVKVSTPIHGQSWPNEGQEWLLLVRFLEPFNLIFRIHFHLHAPEDNLQNKLVHFIFWILFLKKGKKKNQQEEEDASIKKQQAEMTILIFDPGTNEYVKLWSNTIDIWIENDQIATKLTTCHARLAANIN